MVKVVVIEFSGLRCQPLRRALGANQFLEPSIIFMEKKCSLLVHF
ncbi:acetyltransferase, partial [Vibrio cholerae]